jgi:hypothetical protein
MLSTPMPERGISPQRVAEGVIPPQRMAKRGTTTATDAVSLGQRCASVTST